jgi:hypothetical protein
MSARRPRDWKGVKGFSLKKSSDVFTFESSYLMYVVPENSRPENVLNIFCKSPKQKYLSAESDIALETSIS